ncbi:hypothetical protein D0860_02339 [Hortaea werneckii]|uniref:Cercosporin MFS transporter CTB4 n=1 Tax=Hortaea werneckii TaxID=91943 RepID=A0A3M7HLR2_HORWE|nr:hypothetical protein D0860_02339 [Hortaea werneckii]
MAFNREDADLAHAEHDAYPERWQSYPPAQGLEREYTEMHQNDVQPQQTDTEQERQRSTEAEEPREEVEEPAPRSSHSVRNGSVSSSGASSTSTRSTRLRPSRLDSQLTATSTRMEKAFMEYLDRHPTAIKRIEDHRLQHSLTVGSQRFGPKESQELPPFGASKPYPPPLPDQEEYVVEFNGHDDPHHAQNWPLKRKLMIGAILILDALSATFASSIYSPAMGAIQQHFGVGREVATLGTSLFVLGYACGPVIFAPISELYGRRVPLILAATGFGIFLIATAVSKDYQTLMISRFFAGLFGSCPLTVVAAVFADMFNNEVRGLAVASFGATVICGPLVGPMVGGFITKSYLGWRFTAYIPAFMGFASAVLLFFFQQESYGPVILVSKAAELRRKTKNWGIHAKQEEVEVDLKELLTKNISRPLRILFTEPIVLLVTIYMSFIYGLLYLSLTAYSLIFSGVYGFSLGVSGLPYVGMIVGVFIAFSVLVAMNPSYARSLRANNGIPVPEWRMPIVMVGGILFSAGLFWLGWGGYMRSTPWIVPTLAGLFLGFGIYTVFLQSLNYIIDAYLMFAASAIAANTIMRSTFGAVFPLFATYMFNGIGINWGCTLLGCVAAIFIPMPFVFYFKGKTIRAKSKFAPAPDIKQDRQRDEESKAGAETNGNGATNGSRNGSTNGSTNGQKKEE